LIVTTSRLKKSAHAAEQRCPDVLKRRLEWLEGQPDLDPSRPVFIHETDASTNLARKAGRWRRGQRQRPAVPHGHYKTVTLVAGLSLRGIVAQKVFDRLINSALFEEWVETFRRRRAALPAALQPRHEPHREVVRQA